MLDNGWPLDRDVARALSRAQALRADTLRKSAGALKRGIADLAARLSGR